jgi:hypothetical protein
MWFPYQNQFATAILQVIDDPAYFIAASKIASKPR